MSRIESHLRGQLPNRICDHFDKYCEIINPVTFDPIKDIYQPSLEPAEWEALQVLMGSKHKADLLSRGFSFALYLGDDTKVPKYRRSHITFPFPDGDNRLPQLELEISSLPYHLRSEVEKWTNKAVSLRKLRKYLWKRVEAVLDHGWDQRKYYDNYRGCYRGGPTPGQGVNTAGQLVRLWPELLPFLPSEYRNALVNASVKSRLPKFIVGWGTPDEFRLRSRPYKHNHYDPDVDEEITQSHPMSDEEWATAKRMLEAVNHILVQMSLMKDVNHVTGYPSVAVQSDT